jgi:hypothetical protein
MSLIFFKDSIYYYRCQLTSKAYCDIISGIMKERLNLNLLRSKIRTMQRWQPLYKMLRDELTKLGYWRAKPRGNPKLGYQKYKESLKGK